MPDRGYPDPLVQGSHAHDAYRQDVLNVASFPPLRDQQHMASTQVRARVVWERDGEQYITGWAEYWSGRSILVHWDHDRRLRTLGVWLDVDDVQRITATPGAPQ